MTYCGVYGSLHMGYCPMFVDAHLHRYLHSVLTRSGLSLVGLNTWRFRRFINNISIRFAIRQRAAWTSTLITHKHSPEEEELLRYICVT